MPSSRTAFYVVGGSLPSDAPCYMERRADHELLDALSSGEFCHVLTSRQMGKSSLMLRTAARLREDGCTVAVLDLTALGSNLTVSQWYLGLLELLGEQLGLEAAFRGCWRENLELSPLQRWLRVLREVALARPEPLVIFVDEIDAVLSLPFSSDEFFAGIRECYNRRSREDEFARLTFCLLGVATPPDLIRDPRSTPFNIGRRITLTDFTPAEAGPLKTGFLLGPPDTRGRSADESGRLLERVLYWTGGHPYLTQRLCQVIAENSRVHTAADVDRVCAEVFLNPRGRARDDNLLFVRAQLVRAGDETTAELLELYRRVLRGRGRWFRRRAIADEETNELVSRLRLSGVARAVDGYLQVRNHIYAAVFDEPWIERHLPKGTLRLQRAAYRRGAVRTALVGLALVLMFGGLAMEALQAERRARATGHIYSRLLYLSDVVLAEEQIRGGFLDRAQQTLAEIRDISRTEKTRDWEWGYVSRRAGSAMPQFEPSPAPAEALAFSADGTQLVSCAQDGRFTRWDPNTGRALLTIPGSSMFPAVDQRMLRTWVSPDGRYGIRIGHDWRVAILDLRNGTVRPIPQVISASYHVYFSADGHRITLTSPQTPQHAAQVGIWELATGRRIGGWELPHSEKGIAVTESLMAWVARGRVHVAEATSGRELASMPVAGPNLNQLEFSPDGRRLAALSRPDRSADGWLAVWDLSPARALFRVPLPHDATERGWAASFSPDGTRVLAISDAWMPYPMLCDRKLWMWEASSGRQLLTVPSASPSDRAQMLLSYYFTPDGRRLATLTVPTDVGRRGVIQLWDVRDGSLEATLLENAFPSPTLAVSPNGGVLAFFDSNRIRLCPVPAPRSFASADALAFTADGGSLFATVATRPAGTGQEVTRLLDLDPNALRIQRDFGPIEKSLSLAASPAGTSLALGESLSGGEGGALEIRDVPTGARRLRVPFALPIRRCAFDATGRRVLVCGWRRMDDFGSGPTAPPGSRGGAWVVDAQTGSVRGLELGEASAIAISPDGKLWAVATTGSGGAEAGGVSILSAVDMTLVRSLRGAAAETVETLVPEPGRPPFGTTPAVQVRSLAFSPGGELLACGRADGTVDVWDPRTGRRLRSLQGHTGAVQAVAFSPSGQRLASGGVDRDVRLWDVGTGRQLLLLREAGQLPTHLSFSPDGLHLACTGVRGVIRWTGGTGDVPRSSSLPRPGSDERYRLVGR